MPSTILLQQWAVEGDKTGSLTRGFGEQEHHGYISDYCWGDRITVADLLKYSGNDYHFQGSRFRGSVEYYSQYYQHKPLNLRKPTYYPLLM
jgi:hypothetical protein